MVFLKLRTTAARGIFSRSRTLTALFTGIRPSRTLTTLFTSIRPSRTFTTLFTGIRPSRTFTTLFTGIRPSRTFTALFTGIRPSRRLPAGTKSAALASRALRAQFINSNFPVAILIKLFQGCTGNGDLLCGNQPVLVAIKGGNNRWHKTGTLCSLLRGSASLTLSATLRGSASLTLCSTLRGSASLTLCSTLRGSASLTLCSTLRFTCTIRRSLAIRSPRRIILCINQCT